MAKITRKNQKILGSNSANNGQLGSARDGAFVLSDDPDVLQGLSAWDDGLLVATLTGERLPTVEEIQGIYYVLTRQVAYIMQEGIAEYSADTTYYQNSIVKEAGTVNLYRSLTDDNIGNALSNGAEWEFLLDLSEPNPDGSVTLAKLADIPANTILMNPTGSSATPQAVEPYAAMPIGMPFPVLNHLAGVNPPSNAGDAKFIKLTASDAYNTGFLTNESITGTAPLVVATADIDYVGSPMNGETIHLLNTENRYLMPHTASGGVANDHFQNFTGRIVQGNTVAAPDGAFAWDGGTFSGVGSNAQINRRVILNPSTVARTANHTNVKRQQAVYYMRIA